MEFNKEILDRENLKGREQLYQQVVLAPSLDLECTTEMFFQKGMFMPSRPKGCENMSVDQLDNAEQTEIKYFLETIHNRFINTQLNLCEMNINTWRQLWRVLERSSVCLFVTDIRFAICQFPMYAYEHIVNMGKKVVLVLNKIDLVDTELVIAWKKYFEMRFPGIKVVPFCSHEAVTNRNRRARLALYSSLNLIEAVDEVMNGQVDLSSWKAHVLKAKVAGGMVIRDEIKETQRAKRKEKNKLKRKQMIGQNMKSQMNYKNNGRRSGDKTDPRNDKKNEGKNGLKKKGKKGRKCNNRRNDYSDSEDEVQTTANCDSDFQLIRNSPDNEDINDHDKDFKKDDSDSTDEEETEQYEIIGGEGLDRNEDPSDPFFSVKDDSSHKSVFTLGTVGFPNVGKSSLINAILGMSKVGVSRNPGFTKHFQTHFLSAKKDILLCDCPGLIFPTMSPYQLQVSQP